MMNFKKLLGFSILSILVSVTGVKFSIANGINSLSVYEAENGRTVTVDEFELSDFIIKTDFAIEIGSELKGGALAKRKGKKRVKRRAVVKRKIRRTVRKNRVVRNKRIYKKPRTIVRRAPAQPVKQARAPRNSFNQDVLNQQEALNLLGFDAGRPDGVTGRRTRAAVSQFQAANGLPPTGQFTPQGLALLTQQAAVVSEGGTVGIVAPQQVAAPIVPVTSQVPQTAVPDILPQTATVQPVPAQPVQVQPVPVQPVPIQAEQTLPVTTQQVATQPASTTQPTTQQVVVGQPVAPAPQYDANSSSQVTQPQTEVVAPAAKGTTQEVLLPPVQTAVKPQQSTPQW